MTAFRPEAAVDERQDGTISVTFGTQTTVIQSVPEGLRRAIRCLAQSGAESSHLEQLVCAHDGFGGLPVWYYWQHRFQEQHLLCYPIEIRQTRIATLLSASSEPAVAPPALQPTDAYALSRFAYCRLASQQEGMLLESPLSPFSLVLHRPSALMLIGALSTPKTMREIAEEFADDREAAEELLAWFVVTRMVVVQDGEEGHPALSYWEFHDLLFHSRSRMGRSAAPFGGTYRFGKDNPPYPVVKPNLSAEVYPLFRPAADRGIALETALDNRRSIRAFDDENPLAVQQLGEFLYRAARVQQVDTAQQVSKRPYPTAGALYELELYVAVHHCSDLPQGLYHYNPLEHQLCKVKAYTPEIEQFVQNSRRAAQLPDEPPSQPQALLLITSRHPRASWKYESIAYANTLKNTGALYQTMYVVAAAMGLGGTAVGCGDSDRFARMTGIEYLEETLVGEFLLGTPAS